MKNEIGRKLTSLTIMAIMFAGGMAIGVPSFMPEAASDLSSTDGMLTVSTTTLQGSAILEIVVNDPDYSDTTVDINSGPSVSVGGTSLDMSQAVNGKWYLYVVDASAAVLAEASADTNNAGSTAVADSGLEYGVLCEDGLGISHSTTGLIVGTSTSVYASVLATYTGTSIVSGGCLDADNMWLTLDDSGTSRENLSAAVLQNAPSLSNHNDATAGQSDIDLGQLGHGLNASGHGSWPYIVAQDLNEDTVVDYGGDSITVTYANTDSSTAISMTNQNPSDSTNIHLTLTDPALNIDPTTADVWDFGLGSNATAPLAYFSNNGTDTRLTAANLSSLNFEDNGRLGADVTSYIIAGASALTVVTMTETGANTGVFESFDATGAAEFLTIDECAGDSITLFSYGGNTVDMICTYNDASISMSSDGAWEPATAVTISVNDPDANKNPTSAETLDIGDETEVIPTIKMGSPLTLAGSGTNEKMAKNTANHINGVVVGTGIGSGGHYTLQITNTTDNSERLRIIHTAESHTNAAVTTTWINVTTGHTRATLVGLPGTVVLNYDVTGPCALLACTAVSVYVVDSGENSTNHATGLISVNTSGNDQAGVYDLNDGTYHIVDTETSANDNFSSTAELGSVFVGVAFKLSHVAGKDFTTTADYAIAADFCNFDQNNGSLVHNCIYRLEAVETGANTGIFEGTVEYINLVNSTSAKGGHAGNGLGVESKLGYVNGDALTVVLMDAVSGSDSVRVVYNDTDSMQIATKIGAQLETSVHTATVDLDADTYGVADIGTITIVDADLNQDSTIRDTYTNSTTTFQLTISTTSGSVTTSQKPFSSATLTAIETGPNTGVFVSTFIIPNFKGADMEVTLYEARNAASSAVTLYDTATITSNTGSVSFDRSVYPVPFLSGDLSDGAGTLGSAASGAQDEVGAVTAWITVTDIDETGDTMTVGGASAGKITVTIGTSTCFTAGGLSSYDAGTLAAESGPLSETVIGSSVYDTSITIAEVTTCAASESRTVVSGDVIQVAYIDQADDAGTSSTQFDSSTFDLRTGTLSVDKDVYVLGSDMVITLTDPDLNLDSSSSESYVMGIIEWDSSATSSKLLSYAAGANNAYGFTNNPSSIEETGSDTGVFQTVTTLPTLEVVSGGTDIDYGEAVTLTYVDVGLSGQSNVGDDTLDVEAYFSISNFGALIELDKAVYNWTDTVYVTITAPDHNVNSAAEETIGTSALPIQASTRQGQMCTTATSKYFVGAETGPDTGIFTSEIALKGYTGDNAINSPTASSNTCSQSDSTANSILTSGQTDGISVSYEYTDAVVVVASASIMFNVGELSFDTSSASAGGSAVLSLTQPDENTNGDVIQTLTTSVFSDSDSGGLTLTLTETDEDTGVFEGTVFFTVDAATSGSNLRVSEGDTVTAEFTDKTLPEPYADDDTLTLASTLTIGTAFPPLERAPAANARVVDSFGSSVAEVTVDQQVQIAADVSNGQSKDQAFAYLVQVQDENGVTVSLAWITGSLTAGQSMSPALSWTPSASGSYTATVFVWESVDNPTALSPTTSVTIDVV